jgi:toxin YhaV
MGERRKRNTRRRRDKQARPARTAPRQSHAVAGADVLGWTLLAHPLFLAQLEKLVGAAEREGARSAGENRPNTKLLAHLLDLVFDKIPCNPGSPAYRHGGTLGADRKNWFRAKTGNGRYRLFYRFHSSARLIVYAWVNDEQTLRAYDSRTDAYAVFARMLEAGDPPGDWDALVAATTEQALVKRLHALARRRAQRGK